MARSADSFPRHLIQVAGISDSEEAELISDAGAHWLGFPLRLPVNKEDISEVDAATLFQYYGSRAVLITYLDSAESIVKFCRSLSASRVQLHGNIVSEQLQLLRSEEPDLFIMKSLVVRQNNHAELLQLIDQTSEYVDAYITDTHDAESGADGATGKTHDWQISRALVRYSDKPVILAGGLRPSNVAAAIQAVRPAGVDV
ncbi:MAG: phosphoribosylanthranilate isomerase, partial [Calditrichota bacterium]